MPDVVLAIDQGTTGSTALVFSREGEILARAASEIGQLYPEPAWVEHDPGELWATSLAVMEEALAASGAAPGELRAIGITNQRETTGVWDRRSGEPVHRAIVWQSRQSEEICQRLLREGHEETIRSRTGLVVDAYFSGTKIRWILDRYPEIRARAEAGEIAFGTVDSWLLWKLTGGAVHATDPTNASRTMLYNIRKGAWDRKLLSILGVPRAMLPSVRPSAGVFGETVPQGTLPGGVPVAGIAGDQQAALYGQCCWEPGMAKNTYGTGAFVMMNMGKQLAISRHGLLTTLACRRDGKPCFALEGSVFSAGSAVQWLRDELRFVDDAAVTSEIAAAVGDTGGVYMVPAFTGLGAPWWDTRARGAILGLTRGSNRAHLVRATLESLAYQTRDVIDAMNADSGIPITELAVDGGAAANDFLMQFQADILGVPVNRPAGLETTATGAAFLAGLGSGFWKSPESLAAARRTERVFHPRMPATERERLYAGWLEAVRRVRSR